MTEKEKRKDENDVNDGSGINTSGDGNGNANDNANATSDGIYKDKNKASLKRSMTQSSSEMSECSIANKKQTALMDADDDGTDTAEAAAVSANTNPKSYNDGEDDDDDASFDTPSDHGMESNGSKKKADDDNTSSKDVDGSAESKKDSSESPSTPDDAIVDAESKPKAKASEMTSKDYYFDSYSHYGIHEEMLKDRVRTETYQAAILQNKEVFKDKIVLDVGCGTGILSMFASQAGAKHVYGIDCSSIIDTAKILVEKNGFKDKITLIKGKVEEVVLPHGVEQVDIIVSEWMGYFLLYESMLDTVLYARDKWLVPDGIIFPDKAVMYLCAAEDAAYKADRIDYWRNVYGFDFSPIREIALKEPLVDVVEGRSIVTNPVPILNIDILKCTKEDLAFKVPFRLTAARNDDVHAFVAYFECAFTQVPKPVGFSTSPWSNYTHWKQTVFYLPEKEYICQNEEISGDIECKPNEKNNRDLDITLNVKFHGTLSKFDGTMEYCLR